MTNVILHVVENITTTTSLSNDDSNGALLGIVFLILIVSSGVAFVISITCFVIALIICKRAAKTRKRIRPATNNTDLRRSLVEQNDTGKLMSYKQKALPISMTLLHRSCS